MSKSFSRIALSVAMTALCAMVVLTGSRSAGAQEALFAYPRVCAADVSPLCAGHGWGPIDAGTAILFAALIGAASTITVTILTGSQQLASFPAPAVTSSAARSVAWGAAIFLYLIAINYGGGAVMAALNWNGAYEDCGRIALPMLVGGVFSVASIWATGRILAEWPSSARIGEVPGLIRNEPPPSAAEA
jgi:hypothetical protein